jgi:hypothetical protein
MTDKKQEFMDWLSKGYDDASEHMEIEGLALCWVSQKGMLTGWYMTGDLSPHAHAYFRLAGIAIMNRKDGQ